ncbi:hypothetical protein U879_01450 [Defluviimonas sp. 20V17]|nr:hypothetical protein U879_01450 [Defluviimonas sp. 20V17]
MPADNGIVPIFEPIRIVFTLYRRSDLPKIWRI